MQRFSSYSTQLLLKVSLQGTVGLVGYHMVNKSDINYLFLFIVFKVNKIVSLIDFNSDRKHV